MPGARDMARAGTGHVPVMLKEAVDALAVKPGGRYVDGTLGRAGHAKEIIARGGEVLGIDRDGQALREIESARGAGGLDGLKAVKGRHGDVAEIAKAAGWESVDGMLLDLGVSSPQLDEAGRGFSLLRDGPLDMRMDGSSGQTAADVVNGWSAERLEETFRALGEEPGARRVARAIAAERESKPFRTTAQLAEFVEDVLGRRGAHHPATRVFQALRMAVNDEIGELERALEGGFGLLAPGGRFVVIAFESLTDRIVKRAFAAHVGREVSLQGGGSRWEVSLPRAVPVTKGAVRPGEAESMSNPRARSARLRAVEVVA